MESISKGIRKMMNDLGHGFNTTQTQETSVEKAERLRKREELQCQFFNETEGTLNDQDGYNCDVCKNRGGYMKVREHENKTVDSVYVQCKCMKIRAMLNKLKRSGLSKSIKEYSFDKYETTEEWQNILKEKAIQFTKDDNYTWFFIGGQSGSGKTHLCTAITAHYLRKNKPARYMLWRDEVTKLKSVITNDEAYGREIQELKTVDVLYIDDLFKMGKDMLGNVQRPTVADINIAFEILNYRYNNKDLITVISSERKVTDIMDIDEAIGGRIFEMCNKGGYMFNLKKDDNKNYRRKGIIEL